MLTRMPDYLVRVASGSSLTWTCGASGTPKPMLRWLQGNRIVSKNSTLNLHSIGPTDEGIYECVASNEAGVAAREVTLYVTGGTMADQYFQRYKLYLFQTVHFLFPPRLNLRFSVYTQFNLLSVTDSAKSSL